MTAIRLPGQRREVFPTGQSREPGQNIAEVWERVVAVALAGDDHEAKDYRVLPGLGCPNISQFLLPMRMAPQGPTQRADVGRAPRADSRPGTVTQRVGE